MADGDKKEVGKSRISERQRFSYIGFEVFPGKPKELFKSDAEKQKLEEGLSARRESASTTREDCTLMEERISIGDRVVLTLASLGILAALLLPWYSAYTVVPIEAEQAVVAAVDPSAVAMTEADTLASVSDSLDVALTDETLAQTPAGEETVADTTTVAAVTDGDAEAPAEARSRVTVHQGGRANEEIITGHKVRAKTIKEYAYLSGFGTFAALGTVGSYIFSSGFILVLSGVLMLLLGLLCIALPVLNLYGLYGLKGHPDEVALKIKRFLRLNWLPAIVLTAVIFISMVGAEYGFDPAESFTSLGKSYNITVLLGSMSWGVLVATATSLLAAVKGIEI